MPLHEDGVQTEIVETAMPVGESPENCIVELDPSKVLVPDGNRGVTPESVTDLVTSVGKDGQIQAIIAFPHPQRQGYFLAADGNRRTMTARILGRTVKAILLDHAPSQSELIRLRNNSNAMRKNASPEDIARDAEELMRLEGLTQAQTAEALHMSPGQLSKILSKAKNACDEVKRAEADGRIVPDVARIISTLPQDKQPEALRQALEEDMTRDLVQILVAKINGTKQAKPKPIKGRTPQGIQFVIPEMDSESLIGELNTLIEAVKKVSKHGLGLAALPSVIGK